MNNIQIVDALEVFAVRANGDVEKYAEVNNSFGGAMHTWLTLKDIYQIPGGFNEAMFRRLWDSIGEMSERDKWVMAASFDSFIVPKEHLATYLEHLRSFVEEYPTPTLRELLTILMNALHDPEVMGVCFNQTATADTWESGQERPYNINIDENHKFLTPAYIDSRKKWRS